ncbi:MAG: hypothetical protein ACYC8T_31670 [Myxococcaceae bacterium]
MKLVTVAILAALALGGCGVGVDDPEGQAAAYGYGYANSAQGLTGSEPVVAGAPPPQLTAPEVAAQTRGTSGGLVDPGVALPQDPVPDRPGRPTSPIINPIDLRSGK